MRQQRPLPGPPSTASGSSRELVYGSRQRVPPLNFVPEGCDIDPPKKRRTKIIVILGVALPVLACIIGISAWAVTTDVLRITPRANDNVFNRGKTRIDNLEARNDHGVDIFVLHGITPTTAATTKAIKTTLEMRTTTIPTSAPTSRTTAEVIQTASSPKAADILSRLISDMPIPKNPKNFVVFAPVADTATAPNQRNGRRFDDKIVVHDGEDLIAEESVMSEDTPQTFEVTKVEKRRKIIVNNQPRQAELPHSAKTVERKEKEDLRNYKGRHLDSRPQLIRRMNQNDRGIRIPPHSNPTQNTISNRDEGNVIPTLNPNGIKGNSDLFNGNDQRFEKGQREPDRPNRNSQLRMNNNQSPFKSQEFQKPPDTFRQPQLSLPPDNLQHVPAPPGNEIQYSNSKQTRKSMQGQNFNGPSREPGPHPPQRNPIQNNPVTQKQYQPDNRPNAGRMKGQHSKQAGSPNFQNPPSYQPENSFAVNQPGAHPMPPPYQPEDSVTANQPGRHPAPSDFRNNRQFPKKSYPSLKGAIGEESMGPHSIPPGSPSYQNSVSNYPSDHNKMGGGPPGHFAPGRIPPKRDYDSYPQENIQMADTSSGYNSMPPSPPKRNYQSSPSSYQSDNFQMDSGGPQYFAPPPQTFHTKISYDKPSKNKFGQASVASYERVAQSAVEKGKDGSVIHHHHHHHHEPGMSGSEPVGDVNLSDVPRTNDADRLGTIGIGLGGGSPRGITLQIGGGGGGLGGLLPLGALGVVRNIVSALIPRPALGLNSKVFLGFEVGRGGGLSIG